MPEGPSIVILKELVQEFKGKKILSVAGNTKADLDRLVGQEILDFKSWGKHFLICFRAFTVKVHLMLFGTYRINESREMKPRMSLKFKSGELNFYSCIITIFDDVADNLYDWEADVMNGAFSAAKLKKKMKVVPDMMVCDALMDQHMFSGVGNIIKNEVLFRVRVQPESKLGLIPAKKINELIREATTYSFEFLTWKKADVLKKHWQAHTKKICPRCNIPLVRKLTGKSRRRSFYCVNCMVCYC